MPWANERWGVAGRFMTALGSRPGKYAVVERRNSWYAQVVTRRRVMQADRAEAHFGIGGGVWGWQETVNFFGEPEQRSSCGPHFLALEALLSQALTDRLSIRGGLTLVVPVHLHPVVLAAWRF